MKLICKKCGKEHNLKDFSLEILSTLFEFYGCENKKFEESKIKCLNCNGDLKTLSLADRLYNENLNLTKEEVEKTYLEKKGKTELFKFNFVSSNSKDFYNFEDGCNGEGLWCLPFTDIDFDKMDDENYFGKATVIVLNDLFCYYHDVKFLDVIEVQCRGENRATITSEMYEKSLEENPEELKKTLQKKLVNFVKKEYSIH